jgi:hypothetical protein
MIRTLFKLAVVALLANAGWHVSQTWLMYFKFKDSVQTTVLHRGVMTDEQVRARILELAVQYDVPVAEESLSIKRLEKETIVHAEYTQPVELVPGFVYQWPFTVNIDTSTIRTPRLGDQLDVPK